MSNIESQQQSAYDIIQQLLTSYGLPELGGFVQNIVFGENVVDGNVIVGRIRQTPQYQQRFAGNLARRQAGYNVLSEQEYIGLENTYRQTLRAAGLPAGFYDQSDDFNAFIGGDVSPSELNQRIQQGYSAVKNADPQVVSEMRRLYGVDDSQLAAYFLDPQRATPILIRQAEAAQIASQATTQAQMELTATQAEQLATEGISREQARQGFQAVAQAGELFAPIAGEQGTAMTTEERLGAVFGTSAAAQQRLRQKQAERQAAFAGGGGFATNQQGQSSIV
jgi:hypothetical protein